MRHVPNMFGDVCTEVDTVTTPIDSGSDVVLDSSTISDLVVSEQTILSTHQSIGVRSERGCSHS